MPGDAQDQLTLWKQQLKMICCMTQLIRLTTCVWAAAHVCLTSISSSVHQIRESVGQYVCSSIWCPCISSSLLCMHPMLSFSCFIHSSGRCDQAICVCCPRAIMITSFNCKAHCVHHHQIVEAAPVLLHCCCDCWPISPIFKKITAQSHEQSPACITTSNGQSAWRGTGLNTCNIQTLSNIPKHNQGNCSAKRPPLWTPQHKPM